MAVPFIPNDAQRKLIKNFYSWVEYDLSLQKTTFELLNRRTIKTFWGDSLRDYAVISIEHDPQDWVKPYTSAIARDKANTFIANLAGQQILPAVVAQNERQQIDKAISRALTAGCRWSFDNDGYPSSSGGRKFVDKVTKMVTTGTVHVLKNFVDGRPVSEVIPNEEMLIPNYWQTDIQKQSRLGRLVNNVTYEEAELMFGHLPNWNFVQMGGDNRLWFDESEEVLKEYSAVPLPEKGRVQIIHYWWPVKGGKRQKHFNTVVNGIPMFVPENESPYRHGWFPVVKEVFEMLPDFYWGNSLPNKVSEDKKFRDAWKTLIRAKGKIALLPPLLAPEGMVLDENIVMPGQITSVPGDTGAILQVPGVSKEVSQNDVAILELTDKEIDQGTSAPILSGLSEGGRVTKGQILLQQSNAQRLLGLFGLMMKFLIEAEGRLDVQNLLQFIPKTKWKKLVVPDVLLFDGVKGEMEIIFEPVATEEKELFDESIRLMEMELSSRAQGKAIEIVKIDPAYARTLDLYVTVVGNPAMNLSPELQQDMVLERAKLYMELGMNPQAVQRMVVRAFGDSENELIMQNPVTPESPSKPKPPSPIALRSLQAAV